MNTKQIAGALYYREIGSAPKVRAMHKRAVDNRSTNKLNVACNALNEMLKNQAYINNYELKLKRGY